MTEEVMRIIDQVKNIKDPVVFSKKKLSCLVGSKRSAELAVYVYMVANGKPTDLFGETGFLLEFSMPDICKATGYKKSKIYSTIASMIELGVLEKVKLTRKGEEITYLNLVYDLEDAAEGYHVDGADSTTVESIPQNGTFSDNDDTPQSANSFKINTLPATDLPKADQLYEEFTTSITPCSNVFDTLRNDVSDTIRDDTYDSKRSNVTIRNVTIRNRESNTKNPPSEYVEQPLFELPPAVEVSKAERELLEDLKRIEYGYQNQPEMLTKLQKPLLRRLEALRKREEAKGVSGYRAEDFRSSTGLLEASTDIEAARGFIGYYMHSVYHRRKINFYIPKSNYGKYISRAKDILEELGSAKLAKLYIDWFLRQDRLIKTGFSLDLLVSTALLNQFRAADAKETRVGLSSGFVSNVEDARKAAHNARRL